jgi:hypothetical protein
MTNISTLRRTRAPRRRASALGLAALLAACADAPTEPPSGAELLSAAVRSTEARDAAAFNRRTAEEAAAGAAWTRDPLLVARAFTGSPGRSEAWHVDGRGEFPSAYTVVAVFDGFSDDSVRGERHDIVLRREPDETWRIARARIGWRCWRGRGQRTYSAERCS